MLQVKLPAQKLAKGMYVSKLDRPWVETPFMFQGFLIEKNEQIRSLQEYCEHVYIDVEKGDGPPAEGIGPVALPADFPPAPLPKPRVQYETETTVEDELEVAKSTHTTLTDAVTDYLDEVRSGKKPDVAVVKNTITEMQASIIRNPDAFMWLRRLKKKDTYTYAHCIDCSVLAIAFGRQMGLPPAQIQNLGIGALMFDVGKRKVRDELLSKPDALTPEEFEEVKKHVGYSLEIMRETRGILQPAIDAAASHHERFDGSGYPQGLKGGEIPLLARMAGIVDFFDAVTSERAHATAMSPHAAIRYLYELRNTQFQDELIEQFIQTLGVYPVGTLVELSNGEVGIVIGQNQVRRLRPKIILVLDADKQPLEITPVRDLMMEEQDESGTELTISATLEPGTYGIQPDEFYL